MRLTVVTEDEAVVNVQCAPAVLLRMERHSNDYVTLLVDSNHLAVL